MENRIINVAVHDLKKAAAGFHVIEGQKQLPVNATVQRVVDDLHELYSRRSSKSHGKFAEDRVKYPTQDDLHAYVGVQPGGFAALTMKLMENLKKQAESRPNTAGGHVFFAHFEREGREFLFVIILTDRLGAALTGKLQVTEIRHLDMDGFRFAGRINMTGWAAGDPHYIGFLRGKGDVSTYFKEFLGCDTTVQERQDTMELVATLREFASDQGLAGAAKDDFLGRAKAICEKSATSRRELAFEALANELLPDEPDTLLDVLVDPNRGLNDGFVPNRRALGPLVKFRAKTPLWSVEFEREALTGGSILFDPKSNSLTIRDLPEDFAAELSAEI